MIKIQNHQLGLYILSNMNTYITSYSSYSVLNLISMSIPVLWWLRYLCTKVFYIHMFLVKYKNSVLMLPYEAVQMKEPFSFHITFCAKTFFAEFSFAWIYQKNVDEKQSLAFQKKLVCRVAVEKVQMHIYISRFIPTYKSSNIFLQFSLIS